MLEVLQNTHGKRNVLGDLKEEENVTQTKNDSFVSKAKK